MDPWKEQAWDSIIFKIVSGVAKWSPCDREWILLINFALFLFTSIFMLLSACNVTPRWFNSSTQGRLFPSSWTGASLEQSNFPLEKTMHFVLDFFGSLFVPNDKFFDLANSSHNVTKYWSPDLLAESKNISPAKIKIPTIWVWWVLISSECTKKYCFNKISSVNPISHRGGGYKVSAHF